MRHATATRGLAFAALLWLGGCAAHEAMTPELWREFREGRIVQDCAAACLAPWQVEDSGPAKAAYDSREWNALAERVILNGYRSDQTYFYLGRAAEGLGHTAAAIRYYQISVSLNQGADRRYRCATDRSPNCDDLNIGVLARERLAALQHARRPAQQRPRPGTAPQIELPPASELELPPPRR